MWFLEQQGTRNKAIRRVNVRVALDTPIRIEDSDVQRFKEHVRKDRHMPELGEPRKSYTIESA